MRIVKPGHAWSMVRVGTTRVRSELDYNKEPWYHRSLRLLVFEDIASTVVTTHQPSDPHPTPTPHPYKGLADISRVRMRVRTVAFRAGVRAFGLL